MKILLWPTLFHPNIGGLEIMAHTLACALRDKGHEILVITHAPKKETFTIDGFSVHTFPFLTALFKHRLPDIREFLSDVSNLIKSFAPDIINIHGWFESFAFYQIRIVEKLKLPVCLTVHGLLEQEHYQTNNCLNLWHRAEVVNTVSHAIDPGLPHPFLQTIHNGFPLSEKPLQPLPKNRLLLVGRLAEEKCYHIAFHALKLLLPEHPDLCLTLVGDGPDYEMLEQLKQTLNLPIEMTGFVLPNEVEAYIDQSSLVLVPSTYESFSLVALEAAIRGRPVVASNILGLKEVIDDQKTGLLVEPEDPEALASAVNTLLKNPLRMEEMGNAAYERASKLFTIEMTTNNYLRMYEKAADLCYHSSV